ncbi:MAG: tetratricopeptide repeat protein [Thiolinea sp.]
MKTTVKPIRLSGLLLWSSLAVLSSGCSPVAVPLFPGPVATAPAAIPQAAPIPAQRMQPPVAANTLLQRRPPPPRTPQRTAIPAPQAIQANRIDIPPELTPAQEAAQRPQTTVAVPPTLNDYRPTGNATRAPIWSAEQAPAATSLSSRSAQPSDSSSGGTIVASRKPSASVRQLQTEATRPVPDSTSSADTERSASNAPPRPSASVDRPSVETTANVSTTTTATTPPPQQPVVRAAPVAMPKAYSSSPAVTVLIKQANNDLTAGKTERAASTLERALRIAPDDPVLWLRLAEINEMQGNNAQAAAKARKAINLAPDDSNLKQRALRLLR